MANLFDQYERAQQDRGSAAVSVPAAVPPKQPMVDDEVPMFHRQRINFDPLAPISHLCVSNNYLVMGLTSNQLTRIEIDHQAATDEIELTKSVDDSIYAMYLDPTGRHMIVSMTSGENFYVARGSKKLRTLHKLKGHKITAVGWNRQNPTDSTTGEILLGTSKGLIIETLISSEEGSRLFSGGVEGYVKQVFAVVKDKQSSVSSIEFDRIPTASSSEQKYFILATSAGRLYQFVGPVTSSSEPPIFSQIFSQYEHAQEGFIELPGDIQNSQLHLFYSKPNPVPKSFAWMTGAGIFCGSIDVSGKANPDTVTTDGKLIQYKKEDMINKSALPISMALTEFHVLILFPNRVRGVCCLNEQTVYLDDFRDSSKSVALLGMCRDQARGVIWAYNARSVFKFKVVREARDVWPVYMDRNEFELAKRYCRESQGDMNQVHVREAEYLFESKKYVESAKVYAETQCSFEEISLKFVALEDKKPLKQFLLHKLTNLKPQEKTQNTMVVVWLVELWLNELGQLREGGATTTTLYEQTQEAFRKFLNMPRIKESVTQNKNTIYQLISSHGDIEDMIFFAFLIQDFERVITHHIQQENYMSALEVLSRQNDRELFYTFSPQLMQNIPDKTVDAWISKKELLDPRRLIPALVQYDSSQGNEAIRYLEYCVQRLHIRDQSIHNYLLSLYAKLKPDQLINYLNSQGQELDQLCYDVKYALRVCDQLNHKEACVHIYSTMGLYDEAVDLALQVNVELAKQNANKPEDNEELKKKLWLKIAQHVVEKEKDIESAMVFLQECDLLKIEDILPFFPEFVTIDHFKDAICTSLQTYSRHIDALKEEMNEATENAGQIKGEIQAFRNKFSFVRGGDKCSVCDYPLMVNSFYLFPCGHKFHCDCLASEVLPHLSEQLKSKAKDLQRKIAARERSAGSSPSNLPAPSATGEGGKGPSSLRVEPNYKEELDEIVAAECLYCGDIMISCVDKPFIEESEYDKVIKSWL